MPVEVHEQEGKVVEWVDGGEGFVECDGVEEHGAASPAQDIPEMHVARTAPQAALVGALVENRGGARELALHRARKATRLASVKGLEARKRLRQRPCQRAHLARAAGA